MVATVNAAQKRKTTLIVNRQNSNSELSKLLKNMPTALVPYRQRVLGCVNKASRHFLDMYRELGKIVQQIKDDPELSSINAVEYLSASISYEPNTLYKANVFLNNYTDSEYELLVKRLRPNGESLTWSHVLELLTVSDKRHRARLESIAANEGLTAADLRELIREEVNNGQSQRPGAGRPFPKPKNFKEFVKVSQRDIDYNCRKFDAISLPALEKEMELPPDQVNKKRLTLVTDLMQKTHKILQRQQRQLRMLESIQHRYCDILDVEPEEFVDTEDEV